MTYTKILTSTSYILEISYSQLFMNNYRFGEELCELLVVEDVKTALRGQFAHRVGMPAVALVAVLRLDED